MKEEELKAKTISIKLPIGVVIDLKPLVRWLGVFFDLRLSFKEYVSIRVG